MGQEGDCRNHSCKELNMKDTCEDRLLFLKIFNAYKAKKRDIGLEHEILTYGDPGAACLYAIHVIGGEWEAAEPIIGKVSAYNERYNKSNNYLPKFPNSTGKLIVRHGDKKHRNPDRHQDLFVNVTDVDFTTTKCRYGIINNTLVSNAYLKLTGKRLKSIEENTKSLIKRSWDAIRVFSYVKLLYELTGEVTDFENGLVAVKIIEAIKENNFSKNPIAHADKEKIIKELEQRMALYSFAGIQQESEPVQSSGRRGRSRGRKNRGSMGAIKSYFETRVEAMNELFKILGEHDENMTIAELKKVLRNEKAA